ncbi:hypothetical protein SAMN04487989_101272 [Bizionia echini]|uniref:Outer membrane protein beta-barrel domain-containing protein n=1 Tax=Bizionia echini TaxID=649333 RepID=A0A1I4YT84_9FLAO|nr:hypothetical protein [Bizionia echini]SFN41232.1 hypothetical protein SAMN04487989_101272 [Bizionia echini]
MKKAFFLFGFLSLGFFSFSQQSYTINDETLELDTAVEGNLDLLWTIDNGTYRYFVKTNSGDIQELVNTKNAETRKYQEEYKSVLNALTEGYGVPTDQVNLTLYSLEDFFNTYNATTDLSYNYEPRAKLQTRLGIFGGITNQPLVENPNNASVPFFGLEFELFEATKLPRHAMFFHFRHALEADDFEYTSTQIAIGYRYRVINKDRFNLYGNLKLVTYDFGNATYTSNLPEIGTYEDSFSGIDIPFILGIGADFRVTENGYITFAYHDIYALFSDNSDNFPIDFALGFKMNL